jgi:predicted dehydrogenase
MKQMIQSFRTGELRVEEVPAPELRARGIVVRTAATLISAGTERMVLDFAERNLLQKAQARPDLVRQVIDKVRREGLLSTLEAVRGRLEQPLPLGYSSAGVVLEIGREVCGVRVGERVACAGSGYATHSEFAYVPRNLFVRLPDNVSFEAGAFATVGAVALQGIRQAEVQLGDSVAVIGLGLIGQLAVQMLRAAGCRVMGIDLNAERVRQALAIGAEHAVTNDAALEAGAQFTAGRGFDAVLITADTKSSEPVRLAGELARDRGTVVAVGAVGMDVPRKLYYDKELQFRIGRSYGPGRYDPDYEERGHDYPYGFVRWTEQRNLQAFVEMCARGAVQVEPLITHRFPIAEAVSAYQLVSGERKEPFTGIVLLYPADTLLERKVRVVPRKEPMGAGGAVKLGVLGAGSFAGAVLLPAIKSANKVELICIASGSGLSARTLAGRYGFRACASDADAVLHDPEVNTVAIVTRHNLHAPQVIAALNAGKNVFVEKPLCLKESELDEIVSVYRAAHAAAAGRTAAGPALMVGYNRRFAPFVRQLAQRLKNVEEPLMIHLRVNAGYIPATHWTQDLVQGGGRLLGEGCHFIDLAMFLAGTYPVRVRTLALSDGGRYRSDNFVVTLEFENGSIATIQYVANGNKSFGKECIEVFGGGLCARLDDYRSLEIVDARGRLRRKTRLRADKGHKAEWRAFLAHLNGQAPAPVPFEELVLSTRATLCARQSLESGSLVDVEPSR